MLTPKEKAVLRIILMRCGERTGCIISPSEISSALPKRGADKDEIKSIIECLEYDGYIDFVLSERRGERVYCITLRPRGKGYLRETEQSKRYLVFRVALAVGSALITFVVGRLLYLLIK